MSAVFSPRFSWAERCTHGESLLGSPSVLAPDPLSIGRCKKILEWASGPQGKGLPEMGRGPPARVRFVSEGPWGGTERIRLMTAVRARCWSDSQRERVPEPGVIRSHVCALPGLACPPQRPTESPSSSTTSTSWTGGARGRSSVSPGTPLSAPCVGNPLGGGYSLQLWPSLACRCFGLHDRPFEERPVFGAVRFMAASGVEKKVGSLREYINRHLPDGRRSQGHTQATGHKRQRTLLELTSSSAK